MSNENLPGKKGIKMSLPGLYWDKLFLSGIIHWISSSFSIVLSVYLLDILDYAGKQRASAWIGMPRL